MNQHYNVLHTDTCVQKKNRSKEQTALYHNNEKQVF